MLWKERYEVKTRLSKQMMTDMVDGVGGASSSLHLWRDQVGLVAIISDHPGLYFNENVCDASDDYSLVFANRLTRKRKELSYVGLDAGVDSDLNKRIKLETSAYSGASFDTHSNLVEAFQGTKPLILRTNCVVTSPSSRYILAEQFTSAEELRAAKVGTRFWSTDNDITGDDEYSRCSTSGFSSCEKDFSQRLQRRDPLLQSDLHISALKQYQNQRNDSWSGGSNLLKLQLGSFIQKEKLRLELEFEEGCSGLSIRALSDCLCAYDSVEPVTGIPDDRLSGNGGSLCGFSGATSSFGKSSVNTGYHGENCFTRRSSMLSSYVRNKSMSGIDVQMEKDELPARSHSNMHAETDEEVFLTSTIPGDSRLPYPSARFEKQVNESGSFELHQEFVLSSGRVSNVTAAQEDTRVHTIDRDFDDYFAKLML